MKKIIVILHGWSKDMTGGRYKDVKEILEKKGFLVFTPDLPGFGRNALNKEQLFFDDYVSFVHQFVQDILAKSKEKKIILIGHSFGGRIAIKFSSLYPELVSKLIVSGASGIQRPLPSVKKKIVFYTTKILKPIFLLPPFSYFYKFFRKLIYYAIGEMDYYKAGSLTQTFKNVYQFSIKNDLERISIPTLLIWGENDSFIPLSDGIYMHNHIRNSQLVVVPEGTHKLPYEDPTKFSKIVLEFIR